MDIQKKGSCARHMPEKELAILKTSVKIELSSEEKNRNWYDVNPFQNCEISDIYFHF